MFTAFRKGVEPLRYTARLPLKIPTSLPPIPDGVPEQPHPFTIPSDLEQLIAALQKPLLEKPDVQLPPFPEGTQSAHPFEGGSKAAHERISHLLRSCAASSYKDTRNGLLGTEFSTKLSAYLAHGCISARQVHATIMAWEDGNNEGKEDKGTAAIRFELLWRDYMRFCLEKYGTDFFELYGFGVGRRTEKHGVEWKIPSNKDPTTQSSFKRWLEGRTSTGLIDAAQRELLLTGYTSNRTRQNIASFLAKHLHIDWRLGAEWYESMLVDYDCASNWGNWAYVAGVGNDPREGGEGRVFNPVKQASDYDPHGDYIKAWVEETRGTEDIQCVWQPWKLPEYERKRKGIEEPLVRINWSVRGRGQGRGRGRGGKRGGAINHG